MCVESKPFYSFPVFSPFFTRILFSNLTQLSIILFLSIRHHRNICILCLDFLSLSSLHSYLSSLYLSLSISLSLYLSLFVFVFVSIFPHPLFSYDSSLSHSVSVLLSGLSLSLVDVSPKVASQACYAIHRWERV